ncbi:TPA: sensor histidine kinase, partial [Campylobacter fetus subsp. venerealis]|nr:sensor histidine kinase [Campylobacter fetus subsp. venerealis]HDX6325232.1 sensor histidine kinase [Campylobacter fetus subsp. venerealis]
MKFSSIFYTITLIFAIATTSIFLAFLWLMDYDKQNYTRELNTKYSVVARATLLYMSELIDENEYKSQIQNFEMPEIKNQKLKSEILTNASILEEISADIGSSAILFFKKRNYLKIVHKDTTLLLQDNNYQPYRYDIIKVIFGLVFF